MNLLAFLLLYVAGVALDVASTLYCLHCFSDWDLRWEFNPVTRNTSAARLIVHAGTATLFLIAVFALGWFRRRGLYPPHPCCAREFFQHVLGRISGRTGEESSRLGRLKAFLVVLCLLAPPVVAMGHYRVAVTNTLQALDLMTWRSAAILMSVRVTEVMIYLAIVAYLFFLEFKRGEDGSRAGMRG